MTCRGWYLCDNAEDLVLVSFARAELPLFTGGVVGIVEAKLAETSFGWGRTRERVCLGEDALRIGVCRVRLRSGTSDN